MSARIEMVIGFSLVNALAFIHCNPYPKGEFSAGSVDPVNFPPPYRGTGSTRLVAGSGTITETTAFINGTTAGYFSFPFATDLNTTGTIPDGGVDPLQVGAWRSPPGLGYVFDPPQPGTNAFPSPAGCRAPDNYQYDALRDETRLDEQGNIFSRLPAATWTEGSAPTWTYNPVVREVVVTSNGEACQYIKSERTLLSRGDVVVQKGDPLPDGTPTAIPDQFYLAWAIIDPGSGVYRVGQTPANSTGVGTQKWGWFRQFLLAYIDGGYLAIADGKFRTQRLFFPRRIGAAVTRLGAGNDVLEFRRGEAGYSPICEVFSFDALTGPVPRSATVINAPPYAASVRGVPSTENAGVPKYTFCLQVQ